MKTRTEAAAVEQLKEAPWMCVMYACRKWISWGCPLVMVGWSIYRGWDFCDVALVMVLLVLLVFNALIEGMVAGFSCDEEKDTK